MEERKYPEYLKAETKKIWVTSAILIILGILIIGFLTFVLIFNDLIAEKLGVSMGTSVESKSDFVTTGSCVSLWNFDVQRACYRDDVLRVVVNNKDDVDIDSLTISAHTISGKRIIFQEEGVQRYLIKTIEIKDISDVNYIEVYPAIKSGNQILVCQGDMKTEGQENSEFRISNC